MYYYYYFNILCLLLNSYIKKYSHCKQVYSHCKQSRSAPVICAVTVPVGRSGARAGDPITL